MGVDSNRKELVKNPFSQWLFNDYRLTEEEISFDVFSKRTYLLIKG
jgi:hypothetical protein